MSAAWITPEQLAKHFQLPLSTVWKKIRRGDIQAKNFGTEKCHRYRISQHEVRRLEAA